MVAERLLDDPDVCRVAEVIFAPVAGFELLNILEGRQRVLVVDTIQTGKAFPGNIHHFPAGVMTPSRHLTTSHQISLPTALDLGRRLGLPMPVTVDVLAVEAADLETLSEQMTPLVAGAVTEAVALAKGWVLQDTFRDRAETNDFGETPTTTESEL